MEDAKATFDSIDINNDGFIEREELRNKQQMEQVALLWASNERISS